MTALAMDVRECVLLQTPPFYEIRELEGGEIDSVNGGLVWFLAGLAVGAVLVGGAYLIAESQDGNNSPAQKKAS